VLDPSAAAAAGALRSSSEDAPGAPQPAPKKGKAKATGVPKATAGAHRAPAPSSSRPLESVTWVVGEACMAMRKVISRQSGLAFPIVLIDEAGSMPLLGTKLHDKQARLASLEPRARLVTVGHLSRYFLHSIDPRH
jgi:hypothetical protein